MDLPESTTKSPDANSQNQNPSYENLLENLISQSLKSESEMIHELAEGIVDKIISDYEEILKSPSLSLEEGLWEDLTAKYVLSAIKENKSDSISIFLESFKDFTSEEIRDAYAYKSLIFMDTGLRNMDPRNKDYMENFAKKHQLRIEIFLGKINQLRHNEFRDYFKSKCHEYAPYVLAQLFETTFKDAMDNSNRSDSE